MTLPEAIAEAVRLAGGDLADTKSLAAVWERVERELGPRVDRMRAEVQAVRCCCDPGGWPAEVRPDGRCERCWGQLRRSA